MLTLGMLFIANYTTLASPNAYYSEKLFIRLEKNISWLFSNNFKNIRTNVYILGIYFLGLSPFLIADYTLLKSFNYITKTISVAFNIIGNAINVCLLSSYNLIFDSNFETLTLFQKLFLIIMVIVISSLIYFIIKLLYSVLFNNQFFSEFSFDLYEVDLNTLKNYRKIQKYIKKIKLTDLYASNDNLKLFINSIEKMNPKEYSTIFLKNNRLINFERFICLLTNNYTNQKYTILNNLFNDEFKEYFNKTIKFNSSNILKKINYEKELLNDNTHFSYSTLNKEYDSNIEHLNKLLTNINFVLNKVPNGDIYLNNLPEGLSKISYLLDNEEGI